MKKNHPSRTSCRALPLLVLFLAGGILAGPARAAGTLTPKDSTRQPIHILDHRVEVTINNGFAMTEVFQTFFNPNDTDLEAIYSFPLPKSASLSEVTIISGEQEIHGEVVERDKARRIYEEERDKGNDSGLAEKNEFYTFDFTVYPVRAGGETAIRFLYYQPLEIDTGVGRYVYPLQEGGTDEAALDFWTCNERVENLFSVDLELLSSHPVADVRTPGLEGVSVVEQKGEGRYRVTVEQQSTSLSRDFVLYYRLVENLPGRVELLAHRPDPGEPGTFMMVVTPGMDLQPLNRGADYSFVLDVSGSMSADIQTMARGVVQAMGQMKDDDRFRIIVFSDRARDLTGGWINATEPNVNHFAREVEGLSVEGGTNVYDGLAMALKDLNDDRATSVVLVTDAVANIGIVDPREFHKLMQQYDVRVFGFVIGNSGNWPLMRAICQASGGFSAGVSNSDDIIGQILLAKSKISHECLHDADLKITGVRTFDVNDGWFGKIYRGQQLVIFGRYDHGGEARISLKGRMTGQDKTYSTTFEFPEVVADFPELERLWALSRIEYLEDQANAGLMPADECAAAVRKLGLAYQLVTDETSMLVLSDDSFTEHGIDRNNRRRIEIERQARANRGQRIVNRRVDSHRPMFGSPSPSIGGGGALDPVSAAIALTAAGLAGGVLRRSRRRKGRDRGAES